MNHKTIPESTRSMLLDLENNTINAPRSREHQKGLCHKRQQERQGRQGLDWDSPQESGNRAQETRERRRFWRTSPQEKVRSPKYCKWCKAAEGPHQTHDTSECHRFDKDDKEVGKPSKPFDSVKKPWKKGGGDLGQMAQLTKKLEKFKKKLKKSKKAAKNHVHNLSDSDSDSDQDSRYSSPSDHIDKRFKLDKPTGVKLNSTDTRPIKATRTALNVIKAKQKATKNSKTRKVTAVAAVLKIFGNKIVNSRNSNSGKTEIKPKIWLNLKKKHLNRSKSHHKGFDKPNNDASKGIIVKRTMGTA